MPQQTARNLVVVRAGRSSLHMAWLADQSERNWDILVSYYDAAAFENDKSGTPKFFCPGGKWNGLHRTLHEAVDLSLYDFFWLPDDDLEASTETINQMFELARVNDFAVCQPALTLDSYFSHFHTLACDGFKLRYVNYAEIMAPCLRRDTLQKLLPYVSTTMCGFGLDDVWCRLQADNHMSAAIFDEVQVKHTRPVGGHLKSVIHQSGLSQEYEGAALRNSLGFFKRTRPVCYAGIKLNGKLVKGPRKMGMSMAASHLKTWNSPPKSQQVGKDFFRMLRRQMIGSTDFRQIHLRPLQDESPNLGEFSQTLAKE